VAESSVGLHPARFRGAVTMPVFSFLHRFRFSPTLFAALVLLPGCALVHFPWGKKPPRAVARTAHLVGTVFLVSEEPTFVLIDNGSLPPPAAGTVLTINTPGGVPVEMKVTQIRKPPFVVADIVKGTPKKGDPVFLNQ
jgi:hypothetical protein